MTNLYGILNRIEKTCIAHKLVNEYHNGDIYEHLNSGEHKYPCIVLTVNGLTEGTNDSNTLSFNLFYVDRLRNDYSNKVDIQSTGVTVLKQVANKIVEDNTFEIGVGQYTFFDEKFADVCSGVYLNGKVTYNDVTKCDDNSFNEIDEGLGISQMEITTTFVVR